MNDDGGQTEVSETGSQEKAFCTQTYRCNVTKHNKASENTILFNKSVGVSYEISLIHNPMPPSTTQLNM